MATTSPSANVAPAAAARCAGVASADLDSSTAGLLRRLGA
jgi:hypothetical protein